MNTTNPDKKAKVRVGVACNLLMASFGQHPLFHHQFAVFVDQFLHSHHGRLPGLDILSAAPVSGEGSEVPVVVAAHDIVEARSRFGGWC